MFYDLYLDLCNKKGVSPTRAALEIGISKSTPSTWKNRCLTPQGETLSKIADYFAVTTDYLLGAEKEKAPTPEDERKSVLNDSGFFRVMQSAKDKGYTSEDLQLALDFLERARKRDQG